MLLEVSPAKETKNRSYERLEPLPFSLQVIRRAFLDVAGGCETRIPELLSSTPCPSLQGVAPSVVPEWRPRRILVPRRLRFGDESFFQEVSLYPGVNFTIDDHDTLGSFQPLL